MYIISSYTLINGISYHLFFFAILQLLCAVLDDMLMSGLSIPIVTTAVCCSRWHIRGLLTSSTQNQKGNKEESSDCQQHPCGLGQHFWRSFEPRWKVDKITTLSHEHGYGNNSPCGFGHGCGCFSESGGNVGNEIAPLFAVSTGTDSKLEILLRTERDSKNLSSIICLDDQEIGGLLYSTQSVSHVEVTATDPWVT